MSESDRRTRGREAFHRHEWAEACDLLSASDRETSLSPGGLELLATAAWLTGRDADSVDAWTRAHMSYLDRGDVEQAARCAFWFAFGLMSRGNRARASGWFGRARRLLEGQDHECVEHGFLLVPDGLGHLARGDAAEAEATFRRAAEIAERFEDPDLAALARLGRGEASVRLGRIDDGVVLLDEAMAAAEAGELSPIVVGTVYCAVIETCHDIFELRRAAEWTEALTRWCRAQPELVLFRGQCLVRRAEILQLRGEWPEALEEAREACERLTVPPGEPAAGLAYYRRAELHRLRGEQVGAEQAYGEAARWGRKPQPGLALLRLAQGDVEAASASIRRVVEEAEDPAARARILPAHVRIMLAADDETAARASAVELGELAEQLGAPFLRAAALHARGAVELAGADAASALDALRAASSLWEEIPAPYEAARTRVLIGLACRRLGDEDTARVEIEAARRVLERLRARPDLERLDELLSTAASPGGHDGHGLSPREIQVLRLVAEGHTNRAIAADLSISERTVERHVSNMFRKLGVSTRSAATAYAYEHDLV